MLCGLKYCLSGTNDAQIEARYRDKEPWDHPFPREYTNRFDKDKYQLACFVYHVVLHRSPGPKSEAELNIVWPNEPFKCYMKVHLKHLACCMFQGYNFSVAEFLKHPTFMSLTQMSHFGDRMVTFTKGLGTNPAIERNRVIVFRGRWSSRLVDDEAVLKLVERSGLDFTSLVALWIFMRNRRQHRDEDELAVQITMGRLPEDNILYWLNKFPYFFIHIYYSLAMFPVAGSILALSQELVTYYESRDADFYRNCAWVPLVSYRE